MLNILMMKLSCSLVYATIILIVADTVFGFGRAVKQHVLNSSFGIDGAIRKVSMIIALIICACMDIIVSIDLVPILPNGISDSMNKFLNISHLGVAEFFALLFVLYEIVSVLKNMYLCGLPVKGVYEFIRKFLLKYTDELPEEEIEK